MREADAVFAAGPHASDNPSALAASIQVNGEPFGWRPGLSLTELLRLRAADDQRVATAVNGAFIGRELRSHTLLAPGDSVLVFGAIVGG